MPNILKDALNSINGIIKNQTIKILKYDVENVNGMPQEQLKESIITSAHIQPITPNELAKYTDSTIDSSNCYKAFLIGDNITLFNSILDNLEKTYIEYNNKVFKIYAKKDWSLNGWICVYMSMSKNT